jgi:hypothetical protein
MGIKQDAAHSDKHRQSHPKYPKPGVNRGEKDRQDRRIDRVAGGHGPKLVSACRFPGVDEVYLTIFARDGVDAQRSENGVRIGKDISGAGASDPDLHRGTQQTRNRDGEEEVQEPPRRCQRGGWLDCSGAASHTWTARFGVRVPSRKDHNDHEDDGPDGTKLLPGMQFAPKVSADLRTHLSGGGADRGIQWVQDHRRDGGKQDGGEPCAPIWMPNPVKTGCEECTNACNNTRPPGNRRGPFQGASHRADPPPMSRRVAVARMLARDAELACESRTVQGWEDPW